MNPSTPACSIFGRNPAYFRALPKTLSGHWLIYISPPKGNPKKNVLFFPSSISPTDKLLELHFVRRSFSVGFLGVKTSPKKPWNLKKAPKRKRKNHIYIYINHQILVFHVSFRGCFIMAYIQWIILVQADGVVGMKKSPIEANYILPIPPFTRTRIIH